MGTTCQDPRGRKGGEEVDTGRGQPRCGQRPQPNPRCRIRRGVSTTDYTDDTDRRASGSETPIGSSLHPCHQCHPWSNALFRAADSGNLLRKTTFRRVVGRIGQRAEGGWASNPPCPLLLSVLSVSSVVGFLLSAGSPLLPLLPLREIRSGFPRQGGSGA